MMEEWKQVSWYEWYYEISNLGNIRSIDREYLVNGKHKWIAKGRILSQNINHWWYYSVLLSKKWVKHRFFIHRLVVNAFIEDNWLEINHKNWIKSDNSISNLELITHSENVKHSFRELLRKPISSKWKLHWRSKPIIQYDKNRNIINKWESINLASIWTWIKSWNIYYALIWKFKQMWWYIWRYDSILY